MTALVIMSALSGAALWAAFLLSLHMVFTRQARRDLAAGAAFRRRVQTHVYRGGSWS